MKISKRLGGDRTKEAIEAVQKGDFAKAIEITLHYYDKAYLFGLGRKQEKNIYYVNTDTDDIEINARLVLEAAGRIGKMIIMGINPFVDLIGTSEHIRNFD